MPSSLLWSCSFSEIERGNAYAFIILPLILMASGALFQSACICFLGDVSKPNVTGYKLQFC
uniref:Uncharacterized protein n=1 Tax=Arundo donax TaxID=35708 RepID=A0A0A9HN07_ARUDO